MDLVTSVWTVIKRNNDSDARRPMVHFPSSNVGPAEFQIRDNIPNVSVPLSAGSRISLLTLGAGNLNSLLFEFRRSRGFRKTSANPAVSRVLAKVEVRNSSNFLIFPC